MIPPYTALYAYIQISDQLLLSALFSSSILVICISAKSYIGATLMHTHYICIHATLNLEVVSIYKASKVGTTCGIYMLTEYNDVFWLF